MHGILDKIFLVSLNMVGAQNKIGEAIQNTLKCLMKQVYHNAQKWCIFTDLKISIHHDFERMKNDDLDDIFYLLRP